jgi:enoyl-CoA hydratase/carnithine racemase
MPKSAHTPGIRFDLDGAIARVTLDRPERHNTLEASDVATLRSILDQVDATPSIRVLVLTGSGEQTFTSGASLAQMESGEMSGAIFDTLTQRIASVRVPTICALNGSVYGGGAELALCCDLRIGVAGSRLSVPAARLGVCYPVGGLTRYVERLGLSNASRILLAAEELDASEMLRVGFLTHLFEHQHFSAGVDTLAARISALSPLAVQSMKRILGQVAAGTLNRGEADALIARCSASEDFVEGMRAWRERRPPNFSGS